MTVARPTERDTLGSDPGPRHGLGPNAFAKWLARHPLAVVVANLVVTAALGVFALHIRIENSLESMLPAGDPSGLLAMTKFVSVEP